VAGNDKDADDGAVLTFGMTDDIAGLTFHADGSYSFDAGNAAYQSLNAGQTMDVVANYTVTDEHGASSASTLTLTVHGANEAPPPAQPTLHSAAIEWSVDGKTDPNGGHLDLLGSNWSNVHLAVNGTGDFDWQKEGFDLTGDAAASYSGPNDHNSTGNSGPETQLNFSTGNVAVSIDTSKLADGSFDYDVALTDETSNKSDVFLTLTYDYWA
jgi:VCBS repeat-containing protein